MDDVITYRTQHDADGKVNSIEIMTKSQRVVVTAESITTTTYDGPPSVIIESDRSVRILPLPK